MSGCSRVSITQDSFTADPDIEALITVPKGHSCDPGALMQAIVLKYPGIDPVAARQKVEHVFSVLACPLPGAETLEEPARSTSAVNGLQPEENEVFLQRTGQAHALRVIVNGIIPMMFILDTGATDVVLPADVVFTLLRTGTLQTSDFISYRPYTLADGRELPSAQFNVRELQVGQYTIRNVTAGVGQLASEPLLGQSFLSRFGSATIDYKRNVLVLSK